MDNEPTNTLLVFKRHLANELSGLEFEVLDGPPEDAGWWELGLAEVDYGEDGAFIAVATSLGAADASIDVDFWVDPRYSPVFSVAILPVSFGLELTDLANITAEGLAANVERIRLERSRIPPPSRRH